MKLKVDENTNVFELITENTTLFFVATLNFFEVEPKVVIRFGKYGDYHPELHECDVIAEKIVTLQGVEGFNGRFTFDDEKVRKEEINGFNENGSLFSDMMSVTNEFLNEEKSSWLLTLMDIDFEFIASNQIEYEYNEFEPIIYSKYKDKVLKECDKRQLEMTPYRGSL